MTDDLHDLLHRATDDVTASAALRAAVAERSREATPRTRRRSWSLAVTTGLAAAVVLVAVPLVRGGDGGAGPVPPAVGDGTTSGDPGLRRTPASSPVSSSPPVIAASTVDPVAVIGTRTWYVVAITQGGAAVALPPLGARRQNEPQSITIADGRVTLHDGCNILFADVALLDPDTPTFVNLSQTEKLCFQEPAGTAQLDTAMASRDYRWTRDGELLVLTAGEITVTFSPRPRTR